jgi:two-component system, OmpR family, response regulator
MRILLIEDDTDTSAYIINNLIGMGHAVDHAIDGIQGYDLAESHSYDVLIIDRMLPKQDGLTLIGKLRANQNQTPILILSALADVNDRVEGLRAGADDYLVKPYAFSELLARVDALNRRNENDTGTTCLKVGPLQLDLLSRVVTREGSVIELLPREFRLLEYLMRHADQVITRSMLLEHVWDYNFDPQTNVIDVHISRLRSKIDKGYASPMLHTVRGSGYSLKTPS